VPADRHPEKIWHQFIRATEAGNAALSRTGKRRDAHATSWSLTDAHRQPRTLGDLHAIGKKARAGVDELAAGIVEMMNTARAANFHKNERSQGLV